MTLHTKAMHGIPEQSMVEKESRHQSGSDHKHTFVCYDHQPCFINIYIYSHTVYTNTFLFSPRSDVRDLGMTLILDLRDCTANREAFLEMLHNSKVILPWQLNLLVGSIKI